MRQPGQTPESIQSDFDLIASLPDESWDHNAHYHAYLLARIPERCRQILEIGCGSGEFSRLLSARAERVLALDLSPRMIQLARQRSEPYPNIDFVEADVMTYELPDTRFDCIATLTTMHHLPAESILRRISKALKPGGTFVCLDLYERANLLDLFFDAIAYPTDLFLRLIKTGKPRPSAEVRAAYAEHGRTDTYLTLAQVERTCADILPGALVSRHLFWRYSIIWKKPAAGPI